MNTHFGSVLLATALLAGPLMADPPVKPLIESLTRDVYAKDDPAAIARLRAIITGDGQLPNREQAIGLLASVPTPALAADLESVRSAKNTPVTLRAAAAITLYQWNRSATNLNKVLELQAEGAPVRVAFRTGYHLGRYLYDTNAKASLRKGLGSRGPLARIDAAAGLVELDDDPALIQATLLDVLKTAERWDDRMAVLTTISSLPPAPWHEALWLQAAKDREAR